MNADTAALRARNLRTLALLAALFLLPLLLAFLTYYGSGWRPAGHVNHGELISPPRPLPPVALPVLGAADRLEPQQLFRHQWTLVYVGDGQCADECRAALVFMRQTRLSLNSDMRRVARVFLASSDCCARAYLAQQQAGLTVVDASTPQAQSVLQQFPAERAHTLFVVDPLGNLMMSYDARQNPHGLLEDLKNLLRLSQIG